MGSHVVSSQLGANVNLSCPAVDPAANVTVQWVLRSVAESTVLRQWAGVGGRLLLKSVQLQDSGNYSCYLDDHPAGSVYLLVDGELCGWSSDGWHPCLEEKLPRQALPDLA